MKGPWAYCQQLRALVGGAEPVAVFRGANRRHPTTVFVYDRLQPVSRLSRSTPPAQLPDGSTR